MNSRRRILTAMIALPLAAVALSVLLFAIPIRPPSTPSSPLVDIPQNESHGVARGAAGLQTIQLPWANAKQTHSPLASGPPTVASPRPITLSAISLPASAKAFNPVRPPTTAVPTLPGTREVQLMSIALPTPAGQTDAVATANVPGGIAPPPLELEREQAESKEPAPRSGITIETGFECSPQMPVRQLSPTHFALEVPSKWWFMFRVHGAAGKLIRFDIVSPGVGLDAWSSLNPVYTYATDLDDPATYAIDEGAEVGTAQRTEERAWNGAVLPSTAGQKWHYIPDAWEENVNQFSFVQRFDANDAVVAMRVPYPPGYNERFFANLASNPHAKVIEIGHSMHNRPLLLAEIGDGGEEAQRQKPCILIYAGEHADEPDAMWVAQGTIDYLLQDSVPAAQLRKGFTLMVVPMLDPDASAAGEHMGIICTFVTRTKTLESVALSGWFRNWVDAGKRLDVVLDLHNVQSSESSALACALAEGSGARGTESAALNARIVDGLGRAGFSVAPEPWSRGWSPDRLGGWLSVHFGPITLAYEANSQGAGRHLDLSQMGGLGARIAAETSLFLASTDGRALLAGVDAKRMKRTADWRTYGSDLRSDLSAVESEAFVAVTARLRTGDTSFHDEASIP